MRKALFILGDLDDRDIVWLAENGSVRALATGERLIEAGRDVDHLFFLIDGRLEVTTAKGVRLAVLDLGEVVGEMSFVERRKPGAHVTALSDARVLAVPRKAMTDAFKADPAMGMRFYRALAVFLSDRLRAATDESDAELDETILDSVSMAGDRFLRLIAKVDGRDS